MLLYPIGPDEVVDVDLDYDQTELVVVPGVRAYLTATPFVNCWVLKLTLIRDNWQREAIFDKPFPLGYPLPLHVNLHSEDDNAVALIEIGSYQLEAQIGLDDPTKMEARYPEMNPHLLIFSRFEELNSNIEEDSDPDSEDEDGFDSILGLTRH